MEYLVWLFPLPQLFLVPARPLIRSRMDRVADYLECVRVLRIPVPLGLDRTSCGLYNMSRLIFQVKEVGKVMFEGNPRSTADPLLLAVAAMVHDLQRSIGPGSEVLVHNLREPQHSVISIAGNLTGRKIGAPVTDLLLRMLRQGKTDTNPVNYQTQTPDGRPLRSSTVFIRDPNGEVIGALCINIDVSGGAEVREWLSRHIAAFIAPEPEEVVDEHFDGSIDAVVDKAVKRALGNMSSAPGSLSKPERLRIVEALDQQGIFLVKKSSFAIADVLGISRATLYSDLNQVRGISNSRPKP